MMNPESFVRAVNGMFSQKYKALHHLTSNTKNERLIKMIEEYGYDPKQYHHMERLRIMLLDLLKGETDYKKLMVPAEKELLKSLKVEIKDLEQIKELAGFANTLIIELKDVLLEKYEKGFNAETKQKLLDVVYGIIEARIVELFTERGITYRASRIGTHAFKVL
jgi:hypothetical protein